MTAESTCLKCHAPLGVDARQGFCPRCLFVQVRRFDDLGIEAESGPDLPRSFGEYELIEEIARGGMGIVYKARQPSLERIVAVKMLLFGPLASSDFVKRFRAEASAAAALSHPNIVGIHEVGVNQCQHYFAMDYVQGDSLSKMLTNGPLPARQAARYMSIIAEAIHYAHERGILHRDLKPSNVLIDANDQPRVTDFGLARRLEGDSQLTLTGQVLGSPNYMPPEQATARRGQLDRRSDVYSLGAMLYHLLTGRPPFGAEAITDTLDQVLNAQPMSLRLFQPSLPRDLETICLKCLEKQPDKRYATAQQFAEELKRFSRNEPILARPVSAPEKVWRWCHRKPAMAGALLLIIILLLIVIVGSPVALIHIDRARKQSETARQQSETLRKEAEQLLFIANMNVAQAGWEQNNAGRVARILQETETDPYHGFEWFYWQRQLHLASITLRAKSNVIALGVSPDGRRLASGGEDPLKLWDLAAGPKPQELLGLKGHTGAVFAVAFSPDGARLVSGGEDKTARIWETASGREICKLIGHTRGVGPVAFSPDGRRVLTGSEDNTVRMWDAETGERLLTLAGTPCAFSPNGQQILTGVNNVANKAAVLWDATDGHEINRAEGHTGDILCVAFSPDGNRFATGSRDLTTKVWDTLTGRQLFTLGPHGHNVESIAFSPNGQRIVTASADQTGRVWDATNGQPLFMLRGHRAAVYGLAFLPDGRMVTCSQDATIKIWEADGPRETLKFDGQNPQNWIWGLAFLPDGKRIVAGFSNGQGKVWDAVTGRVLYAISGITVDLSPDGGRILTTYHEASTQREGQCAEIINAETGRRLIKFPVHKELVQNVAFSPDGQRIVTGSNDKTACVWDASTGKELLRLIGHTDRVRGVAFSPDGKRILTSSSDRTARIWDSSSGSQLSCFTRHRLDVLACVFSPDGQCVATGDEDSTILLWEAATGRVVHTLIGHNSTIHTLVFSPDGRRILSSSEDGTARLWDYASGREILVLKGHKGGIYRAVFSRDGQRIATGGQDGITQIWESATPEEVASWKSQDLQVK